MTTNGFKRHELSEAERAFFQRHMAIADKGAKTLAQVAAAQYAIQGALQLIVDQHNWQAAPGHGFNLSEDLTAIVEVETDGVARDS